MVVYWGSICWQGFPDGHRTDFDRGRRTLFHAWWPVSVAIGVGALYSGFTRQGRGKAVQRIRHLGVAWLLLTSVAVLVDRILRRVLDHGIGG